MKPFDVYKHDAEKLVPPGEGYDESDRSESFVWYAYSAGKVFGPYTTKTTASAVSPNVERVCINKDRHAKFWERIRQIEAKACDLWMNDLKTKFNHLPEPVFDACYSKAWDDGHAHGHDEVADEMVSTVAFAERIIKALSDSEKPSK